MEVEEAGGREVGGRPCRTGLGAPEVRDRGLGDRMEGQPKRQGGRTSPGSGSSGLGAL